MKKIGDCMWWVMGGMHCAARLGLCATVVLLALSLLAPVSAHSEWKQHIVVQANGNAAPFELPAQLQIVTERWNRVVAVPYLAYMPEKDRLLMLVSCDYPHQAMTLISDDRGSSWSAPRYVHTGPDGKGDTGMGVGLTYLGAGKALLFAGPQCWFSHDYGESWDGSIAVPKLPERQTWNLWDPVFVDRNAAGSIVRLVVGGYSMDTALWESGGTGYSNGYARFSMDEGQSWIETVKPPEWHGASEITFVRANNGDLVAACRTDKPTRIKETLDHYEGLATSVSKDNGRTWSPLNRLYEWGRHHPSMVVTPPGDIVMTYVVRKGYIDTPDGFPQFGIEAVISHDHGQTWDLDHRYILHRWQGNRKGPNSWWPSSQATSTVLLPDGAILTAFGTGYRSRPDDDSQNAPRDVGLVSWRLNDKPVNDQHTICSAAFDSDLRNVLDPTLNPQGHKDIKNVFLPYVQ